MRIIVAFAAALLVAACSSAKNKPGEGQEVANIPQNIYQPTVHGILALSGGYRADGRTQAIETVWRRAGTGQSVRLQLSPDMVTVQALHAGRYVLDSLIVDGRELLVTGDDERKASPVSDVVLDPGDVTYGGDLVIRERSQSSGSAANMVLRVERNEGRARQAIAAKYSRQSSAMQIRLLRKR